MYVGECYRTQPFECDSIPNITLKTKETTNKQTTKWYRKRRGSTYRSLAHLGANNIKRTYPDGIQISLSIVFVAISCPERFDNNLAFFFFCVFFLSVCSVFAIMKGFTLCFVYLLIAVCSVHSASYYYRAGREVVVPVAEEVTNHLNEQFFRMKKK